MIIKVNRKFRIAAICFLSVILMLSLSGCVRYVELSDRAIVEAVGVDYQPDKKNYRISFQYFAQSSEGGQNQIDKTQANVLNAAGEGESIMQAANNASLIIGKDLLLSENRLVILGKELCKYDIGRTLDFFMSNFHSQPHLYVACAENTAEEIIDIKFKEGYVSTKHLLNMMENAAAKGKSLSSYAYKIMTRLKSKSGSVCLPLMKITEQKTNLTVPEDSGGKEGSGGGEEQGGGKTEKTVVIDGMVLFANGKAACTANQKITAGIQLISNEAHELTVTADTDSNRKVTLTMYDISTDTRPVLSDGKLSFDIKVKCSTRFDERSGVGEIDTNAIMSIIDNASQKMAAMMSDALKSAFACGAEVFGLENAVRHSYPQFYRENSNEIIQLIADSQYNIDVQCVPFSLGLQVY